MFRIAGTCVRGLVHSRLDFFMCETQIGCCVAYPGALVRVYMAAMAAMRGGRRGVKAAAYGLEYRSSVF